MSAHLTPTTGLSAEEDATLIKLLKKWDDAGRGRLGDVAFPYFALAMPTPCAEVEIFRTQHGNVQILTTKRPDWDPHYPSELHNIGSALRGFDYISNDLPAYLKNQLPKSIWDNIDEEELALGPMERGVRRALMKEIRLGHDQSMRLIENASVAGHTFHQYTPRGAESVELWVIDGNDLPEIKVPHWWVDVEKIADLAETGEFMKHQVPRILKAAVHYIEMQK